MRGVNSGEPQPQPQLQPAQRASNERNLVGMNCGLPGPQANDVIQYDKTNLSSSFSASDVSMAVANRENILQVAGGQFRKDAHRFADRPNSLLTTFKPAARVSNKIDRLTRSERHFKQSFELSTGSSLVHSKFDHHNHQSQPNYDDELNNLEQAKGEEEEEEEERKMSQTIQSIQSLSMQLNRAASLSASLDDGLTSSAAVTQAQAQANESTAGKKLTKMVGKKAIRMKELLLQNLGKAHKTTDELFEMYEENFYKQQAQAIKIQKEFKNYMNSLKGAQDAGKSFNICIQQSTGVYQSARHDLVCENLSQLENLNEDLLEKLRDQVQVSLNEYMSQFGELKEKILKRKRKLIDYDSSRRVYELMLANVQRKRQLIQHQPQDQANHQQQQQQPGLRSLRPAFMRSSSSSSRQQSGPGEQDSSIRGGECIRNAASQLVDEARLLKLREQYNYCKIMFETINSELYQELPMVYEKKMKNLLMTLQNYFSLEAQFHSNAGKLYATAGDVIDELPMSIHQQQQQQNPLATNTTNQLRSQNSSSLMIGKRQDEYINKASGSSSGMGSSRDDSSLESSSSPDNSVNELNSASGHDCITPATEEIIQSVEGDDDNDDGSSVKEGQMKMDSHARGELDGESGKEFAPPPSNGIDSMDGGDISCQPNDSLANESVQDSAKKEQDVNKEDEEQALKKNDDDDHDQGEFNQDDSLVQDDDANSVIEVSKQQQSANINRIELSGQVKKVKTSYKYLAEDVDELCFEADEIIQVVEFDENQEQEDGWLMGIREVNGQKGLFPANFTQPI